MEIKTKEKFYLGRLPPTSPNSNSIRRPTKKSKCFLIPVGETVEPLINGLKFVNELDKVFLICSKETKKYAQKIEKIIKSMYNYEKIVIDPSNFEEIIEKVFQKITYYDKLVINLTGGTKIMILSLYFIAQLKESTCFYIFKEKDGKMTKLDVPIMSLPESLENLKNKVKGKKERIIKLLINKKEGYTLNELESILKIKKPTIEGHLKTLEELKMIKRERYKKRVIIKISTEGRILFKVLRGEQNE